MVQTQPFIFQILYVHPLLKTRARYERISLEITVFLGVALYSSVCIYQITGRHITEDKNHNSQRRDNLKYRKNVLEFYCLACLQLDSN
jgi:hypothetical protein